jgi:KUP system potassium uptake protein
MADRIPSPERREFRPGSGRSGPVRRRRERQAEPAPDGEPPLAAPEPRGRQLLGLTLGALGIVFGDIGTSPLYAVRESLHLAREVAPPVAVLGTISLIFWSLTLIVTVKYLVFILRADNHGEGGILALVALIRRRFRNLPDHPARTGAIYFGLFGAALLYGDGIITPAISVLSAIEGLEAGAPALQSAVLPASVGILVALFALQHRGTARIGMIFGPTMLLWFVTLGALGVPWILRRPEILEAIAPIHALRLLADAGGAGRWVLGGVVLCITGGEALYADMGHFGRRPIRLGWMAVVFPSLMLNYLGQGALLLERGGVAAVPNPFYALVPPWALYPTIALATAAAIIASQALISGAFSLTQQAIQLGYLPRLEILHTSSAHFGQIFMPRVNQALMLGTLLLVVTFRHSSALAGAYGIAVTGAMVTTTVLFHVVARFVWRWNRWTVRALTASLLAIEGLYLVANAPKLAQGGLIPVAIALALFVVQTTWRRGRVALADALLAEAPTLDELLRSLNRRRYARVNGTAVFLTPNRAIAPPALMNHLKHNHVLHERVILLTLSVENRPVVDPFAKVRVRALPQGFYQVNARFGFMETPNVPETLILAVQAGLPLDVTDLSFYLGRETLYFDGRSGMHPWRKRLFALLSRNARPATDYFGLPADQVIEIGAQVQI